MVTFCVKLTLNDISLLNCRPTIYLNQNFDRFSKPLKERTKKKNIPFHEKKKEQQPLFEPKHQKKFKFKRCIVVVDKKQLRYKKHSVMPHVLYYLQLSI
jgi:hypothetical protein